MKNKISLLSLVFAGIIAITYSIQSCESAKSDTPKAVECTPCGTGCAPLTWTPDLPADVNVLNQQCANTFAWQSFVALTWPADPKKAGEPNKSKTVKDYGKPGDLTPMTWGTFKAADEVFRHTAPTAWGSNHSDIYGNTKLDAKAHRKISLLHKIQDENHPISDVFQAGGSNLWLTDQDGNLVWYEVKLNETEFDYIYDNKLYDPNVQQDVSVNGKGIWLPEGAIELKASWKIIPEDKLEESKDRYKIILAEVPTKVDTSMIDPSTGQPVVGEYKEMYLGLIGLHIIQKTPYAPQFIWATFEHVDLAPVEGESPDPKVDYILYNPDCPECPVNKAPVEGVTQLTDPTQVEKLRMALPQQEADELNAWAIKSLKKENPKSVFLNYRLVDAQWPSSAVNDLVNQIPLSDGGKTPSVLTNSSMETFVQDLSCLSCHVSGGISRYADSTSTYSGDYSFLFERALPQK
jgi:hypothetical protein